MKRSRWQAYKHRERLDAAMRLLEDYAKDPGEREDAGEGAVFIPLRRASRMPLVLLKQVAALCEEAALESDTLVLYFEPSPRLEQLRAQSAARVEQRRQSIIEAPPAPSFVPRDRHAAIATVQRQLAMEVDIRDTSVVQIPIGFCVAASPVRLLVSELASLEKGLASLSPRVVCSSGDKASTVFVELACR